MVSEGLKRIIKYTIILVVAFVIIFVVFGRFWPGLTEKTSGLRKLINISFGAEKFPAVEEEIPAAALEAHDILCNAFRTYEMADDRLCVVKYPNLPKIPEGYLLAVEGMDMDNPNKRIKITLSDAKTGRILKSCEIRNLVPCIVLPKEFIEASKRYLNANRTDTASKNFSTNKPYLSGLYLLIKGDEEVPFADKTYSLNDLDNSYSYLFKTYERQICFFLTKNGAVWGAINDKYSFDNDVIGGGEELFDGIYLLDVFDVCEAEPTLGVEIYIKAVERFNQGIYDTAALGFDAIVNYYPHHVNERTLEDSYYLLGLSYYKIKDYAKATHYFELFDKKYKGISEYWQLSQIYLNLIKEGIPKDDGCDAMYNAYDLFIKAHYFEGYRYYDALMAVKRVIDDYGESKCIELAKKEMQRFCDVGKGEEAVRAVCAEAEKEKEVEQT